MTLPAVEASVSDDLILSGITKVSDSKGLRVEKNYSRMYKAAGLVQGKYLSHTFRYAIYLYLM